MDHSASIASAIYSAQWSGKCPNHGCKIHYCPCHAVSPPWHDKPNSPTLGLGQRTHWEPFCEGYLKGNQTCKKVNVTEKIYEWEKILNMQK